MTTKLNRNAKGSTTDIVKVAAKRGQKLAVSANGNLQFAKEPLLELYEITVSTFFGKGTAFSSSDEIVQRLRSRVATAVSMDAMDFVANLAVHARTEMHIRTIPIVLVVEFAKALRDNNKQYVNMRRLVCDVIQRADQIADMYAYALDVFGDKKAVPMAIKRGVADAFNKFGEYAFAKYNRGSEVKLRDVLRIVHPAAKSDAQGAVFEKIMKDTLEVPYTWETELSRNGQLPVGERKSSADLWSELVSSGKIGYMALLRNLRNIVEAGVEAATLKNHVIRPLQNPEAVAKSKQLPFDYVQAYNVIKPLNGQVASAVSKALDSSVSNMPPLGGRVWIIVDFSGSMGGPGLYGYSSDSIGNSPFETATLLAAALIKANAESAFELAVTLFGREAKTIKDIDSNASVLNIKEQLTKHRTGGIAGSTNFEAALAEHKKLGFVPDAIVVCTDGEVNGFPYARIKSIGAQCPLKLTIDFSARPSTPMVRQDGWYALAGFSTNMFKWVDAIREKNTVVDALSVSYQGLPNKHKNISDLSAA